jgi:uncharacterized protein (DUF3084 family)
MDSSHRVVVTRDGLRLILACYQPKVKGADLVGEPITLDFRNNQNAKLAQLHAEHLARETFDGTLVDFAERVGGDIERYAQSYQTVREAQKALRASEALLADASYQTVREAQKALRASEALLADAWCALREMRTGLGLSAAPGEPRDA